MTYPLALVSSPSSRLIDITRIFDAQTIATLRQGTSFFASTSMIAIGGALALVGNADNLQTVAEDLTLMSHPPIVWELKLLLVVFFLTNAFLKFVWSNRLFGYCSVIMAAVPNDAKDPRAMGMAGKAAEVNITATRSFNRGLRAVYFALASMCWLGGALLLLAGAILTRHSLSGMPSPPSSRFVAHGSSLLGTVCHCSCI